MDQRSTRIEQDIKDIVHTRVAIAEKLDLLERQVEQKMEQSKVAVRDLVDHTAEVVGGMVHKTKQTFDPFHQFGERPWVMLGGAVMLGYLAGVLEARLRSTGVYPYYTGDAPHEAPVMPSSSESEEPRPGVYPYYPASGGRQRLREADASQGDGLASSLFQEVTKEMMDELDHVKAGLIEAGRTFIRDVTSQIVPTLLRSLSQSTSGGRSSEFRARYHQSDR